MQPYPSVTDNDFNAGVTVGDNNTVSKYDCAMPGPAAALAQYIREHRPDLTVTEYDAWPLYDQDAQASNPFKQSSKVPAYKLVASDGTLYDNVPGQYSPTLAGPLLRYVQQFPEDMFLHLFGQWYPAV